jgi:hypothetical protein
VGAGKYALLALLEDENRGQRNPPVPDRSLRVCSTVPLGSSDLTVSALGFGCWEMGGNQYGEVDDVEERRAVQRAIDLGVTLFDSAAIYGYSRSEEVLAGARLAPLRDRAGKCEQHYHALHPVDRVCCSERSRSTFTCCGSSSAYRWRSGYGSPHSRGAYWY